MHGLRCSPCLILILFFTGITFTVAENIPLESSTVKGKNSLYGSFVPTTALLDFHSEDLQCLKECFRRNQMGSVGFEIIQEQCEQECHL